MARGKKQPRVKLVQVRHGILGNPNTAKIEKAINIWMDKGYELSKQEDQKTSLFRPGYTLLTFILKETN